MSTKIYSGRRIAVPIGRAYEQLIFAKSQAKRLGRELQAQAVAKRATEILDIARLEGREEPKPLAAAHRELRNRRSEIIKSGIRDPAVDWQFELWLFPMEEKTLCIINAEQAAFREWFDAQPRVEEYGFWNNADRPEHLNAQQWTLRKRDWSRALGNTGVPNARCLTLNMFDHLAPMPFDTASIIPFIPPIEDRLKKHTRRLHIAEVRDRLLSEEIAQDPTYEEMGTSLFFKAEMLIDKDHDRSRTIRGNIAHAVRSISEDDLHPKTSAS